MDDPVPVLGTSAEGAGALDKHLVRATRLIEELGEEDGAVLDHLLELLKRRVGRAEKKDKKKKKKEGSKRKEKEKEKSKKKHRREKEREKERNDVTTTAVANVTTSIDDTEAVTLGVTATMEIIYEPVLSVEWPQKGVGLVYEAPPGSPMSTFVAFASLFLVFTIAILSPLVFGLWVYYMVVWKSAVLAALMVVVLSSPFWAFDVSMTVRMSRIFQSWRSYFSLRIWKEEALPSDRKVLFGVFPHGCFPIALVLLSGVAKEVFPEWTSESAAERLSAAIASVFFYVPMLAPLLTWLGCHPAHSTTVRQLVRRGSCALLPDGVAGVFHSDLERELVYVQQRKGFVKLAIQEGAALVPCYVFGHTQLHRVVPGRGGWLMALSRRLRFTIILFLGRWFTPMPNHFPLVMAFGKAIQTEKIENPTEEDVDRVHLAFVQELKRVYYEKRGLVGWHSKELEIM